MRAYIFICCAVVVTTYSYSQTGAGGIGSTDGTSVLELWFDSRDVNGDGTNPTVGASVTTWVDKSGNGVDVTENIANVATYSNSGVTFNNTGYLLGSDVGLPSGNASRTVYIVALSPDTPDDDVLFFYGKSSDHNSFGVLKTGTENVRSYFYGNDLDDAGGWLPFNQSKIVQSKYISGTPGARSIYVNGSQTTSDAPLVTPNTITGIEGLQIGGWEFWILHSLATIQEILFYSSAINDAQSYIIDNYLAAKYGLSLSVHDIYNADDAINGDYDYDVAGIGRIDPSNIQNDSQGTGIVRILNATNLGNNEFLIWGHDGGIQQAINNTDVPIGVEARFERVWRVNETKATGTAVDVGAIDMRFDLQNLGAITTTDLRLLVDTNNDGLFADDTPISGATSLGGTIYAFTGVTAITNNVRFTLGTANATQTPLPINLLSFTAQVIDEESVRLTWQTASETNNDFFTIERSKNGVDWTEITMVDGAGNAHSSLHYMSTDNTPLLGNSYYRLKQTDFDSQYSYSPIVSVFIYDVKNPEITIFPNPANNQITIYGCKLDWNSCAIYNIYNRDVTEYATVINASDDSIILKISKLPPGVYLIKTGTVFNKLILQY